MSSCVCFMAYVCKILPVVPFLGLLGPLSLFLMRFISSFQVQNQKWCKHCIHLHLGHNFIPMFNLYLTVAKRMLRHVHVQKLLFARSMADDINWLLSYFTREKFRRMREERERSPVVSWEAKRWLLQRSSLHTSSSIQQFIQCSNAAGVAADKDFFCHAFSLMLYSFPQDLAKLTLYVYDACRTPWNMLDQVQVLHMLVSQFGVHVLLDNAYQWFMTIE